MFFHFCNTELDLLILHVILTTIEFEALLDKALEEVEILDPRQFELLRHGSKVTLDRSRDGLG